MTGFVLTAEGVVSADWIDTNGHMNIMWYTSLFDQGCKDLMARIGITTGSLHDDDITVVAARIATTHRRELMTGDSWRLWSGLLNANASKLTFTHRLVSGGMIRAVCHIQSHAFDVSTRMRSQLPNPVVAKASSLVVPGLVDPFSPTA